MTPAATAALGPFSLASLASLGFVFEALVGEKHLFAGGKNELSTTLRTLQYSIVVFHEPLSPGPVPGRRLGGLCTGEPRCLRKPVSGDAGRGSLGPAGTKLKHEPKTSLPYGGLILGSAAPSRDENGRAIPVQPGPPQFLIRFPPLLLAQSLPRKRFLCPALLAGFHVEAMLLDFLDDVFLLHLALKTPQGVFQGFTLLDDDLSHVINSPPIRFGLVSCGASRRPSHGRLCTAVGTAPGTDYRMYCPLRRCTLKGRWHLLINSRHASQGIFAVSGPPPRY